MNWKNSICLNLTLAKGLSTLPSFITLKSSRALCCASAAILKGAGISCYLHHRCGGRVADVNKNRLFPKEVCVRGNVIMLASKSRSDVILYKMEKEVIDAGKPMFFNQCFDKGRLKNFVLWFLLNYGESKTVQLVEQLKNVGFQYASKAGISLGIDDLKIPPKKNDLIYEAEKLTQVAVNKYASGEITGVERFQSLIDIWHRTSEFLKQEVISYFEATDILNPVYMMAFSGARGNISQVRQLVGMRGLMADPQGQIIDFPIRSNFREGLTLTEYIISSYGARKGIVDTALRTANAGYLTRRLVDVAQHVIISNFDCGTRRGIFLTNMKEGNKTIHSVSQRIVGRILARDLFKDSDSPNPIQIASRNDEVTLDLAFEIGKYFSKVFVRSALTCETSKQICQLCYGWSLAQGNFVSIGEAVGVVAAQSIGEPGTQLTMRTFHTGGVFSGDVSDQIKAPFDGIVEYEAAIPGTLIRTPEGRIAFLTKVEGYFYVHKPINNFDSNVFSLLSTPVQKQEVFDGVGQFKNQRFLRQSAPKIGREKLDFSKEGILPNNSVAFDVGEDTSGSEQRQKLKESLFSESKKFKIPSLTLLYIKNGQRVYAKDVIAQISSISRKANAAAGLAEEAELTIKSECEGQFYSKSLVLNEKEIGPSSPSTLTDLEAHLPFDNPNGFEAQEDSESIAIDKIYQSWTWGYAWILSGKIYEYKLPSLFFPKLGDFMNSKSYISQIEWKLNPSNGHNVFYDIHKRTPGNILNKKHYTPLLPSALFAPVQDAHQEKIGDSFFTVKKAKKGIGLKSNESFNETLMCKAQSNSTQRRSGVHVAQCENVSPMQSSQILFFDLTKILYKKYGYAFQLPEKNQFFQKSKIASLSQKPRFASARQKQEVFDGPEGRNALSKTASSGFGNASPFDTRRFLQSKKRNDLLFFLKSLTMVNTSNTRTELPYFLQWFPSKNQTLTGGYVLLPLGETNPTMDSIISQKSHFLHKFNTSFFSLFDVSLRSSPSTPTAGVEKPRASSQKPSVFELPVTKNRASSFRFFEPFEPLDAGFESKSQENNTLRHISLGNVNRQGGETSAKNFNKNFYTKVTISTLTGATPAVQGQKRSAHIKGRSVSKTEGFGQLRFLNSRQKPPVVKGEKRSNSVFFGSSKGPSGPLKEARFASAFEAVKISYGDFREENELNTNKNISLKLLSTLIKKNQNKIKTHRLKEEARCASLLPFNCPSSLFTSRFSRFASSETTAHTLSRFKKGKPTLPKARAPVPSYSLEGQGLHSALPPESVQALEMKKTEALESRILWVSSSFFKIKLSSLTNCKTSLLFNTSKDSPLRFFFLTQPFEKSPFFNEQNELRFCPPTLRAAAPLTSEQDISTQSRSDEEVQETKNKNFELSQGEAQSSIKKLNFVFFNKKMPMFLQTNRQGNIRSEFKKLSASRFFQKPKVFDGQKRFKNRRFLTEPVFELPLMCGFQKYNFDSLSWGSANKHMQNPLETEGALLKLKVSNFLTSLLPSTLPTPSSSHICASSSYVQSSRELKSQGLRSALPTVQNEAISFSQKPVQKPVLSSQNAVLSKKQSFFEPEVFDGQKRFIDTPMSFEPSPKAQQALENNKTIRIKGTKRINDKKRKLSYFKQFEFANLTTYCRFVNTSLSSVPSFTSLKFNEPIKAKTRIYFGTFSTFTTLIDNSFNDSTITALQRQKRSATKIAHQREFQNLLFLRRSALLKGPEGRSVSKTASSGFGQLRFLNSRQKPPVVKGEKRRISRDPSSFEEPRFASALEAQRSLFLNSFVYSQESNFFVSNYVEKEYKRFNKIKNKENFYSFMNQRASSQKPCQGRSAPLFELPVFELPFQLTPCLQIHYIRDNTNRYIKANLLNTLPTSIEKGATPLFIGQKRSEEDAAPQRLTIEARSISKKKELRRGAERSLFVKAEAKAKISKSLVFSPSAYGALKKGWVVIPASSKLELWKLHKKRINPGQVLMDKMSFNTPQLTECFLFNDIFNIEKISLPKSFSFGSPTLPLVPNTKVQHLALAPSGQSAGSEKRDVNGLYWVKNKKSRYFMPSPQPVQKPSVFDGPEGRSIESNSLIKNNVKIGLFIQPVEEYKKMSNFEFKNYVYESNSNTLKNLCKNIESLQGRSASLYQKPTVFGRSELLEKSNIVRFASPSKTGARRAKRNMSKKRSMLKAIKNQSVYWLSAKLRAKAIQSRVNQSFDSLLNWQKYKYNLYNKQNRTLQPLAKFTQKDFSVFSVALWTERTKGLFEKYLSSLRNFKGRSEAVSASFGTSSTKAKKSQAKKVKEKAVPNTTKKSRVRSGLKSNLPVQKPAGSSKGPSGPLKEPRFASAFEKLLLLDKPLLPYVVSRKPLNLSPFLISFDNFSLLLENQRLSNLSEDITNQKDSLFKPVRYQKVSLKQTLLLTNPIIRRSGALQNFEGSEGPEKLDVFDKVKNGANFDKNTKTASSLCKEKRIALAPLHKALQIPPGLESKGVQSSHKNLHPVFGKGKDAWNFSKNANRKEPSTKINPNNPNKGYFNLSLSYQTYMVSYPPISKFDSLLDPSLNQNLNLILSFYLNKTVFGRSELPLKEKTNSFYFNRNNLIQNVFESPCFSYNLAYPIDKFTLYKKAQNSGADGKMQNTQFFYSFPNNSLSGSREEIQSNKPFAQTNYASPFIGEVVYTNKNLLNLPLRLASSKRRSNSVFCDNRGFVNSPITKGASAPQKPGFEPVLGRNDVQKNRALFESPLKKQNPHLRTPFGNGATVIKASALEAKRAYQRQYKNQRLSSQKAVRFSSKKQSFFEPPVFDEARFCQKPSVVKKNSVFFEETPLSYSCMFLTQKDLISFYLPSNNLKQSLNINYGQNYQINDILVKFLNMTENTDSENIIKQLESFVSITSKDKTVVNTFTKMLSKRKDNFLIKIDKLEAGLPLFAASSFSKTQSINKEIKTLDNKKRFASAHMSLLGDFIMYGDPINNNTNALDKGEDLREASGESLAAICANGQIIHYNNKKITLRRGQPIFISPKSILHKNDGEFIDPKTPVITLSYQKLKTGDIIQGIPKVEQFLEARTTKRGRLFRDSLPSLLKALFNRYQSKLPLELAVRQSFYKIQQIIVDGVQRVYKSQGVTIADKHLEVIVKQMTSKVRIIDGAQTGFFPGEIVDLNFVEKINKFLIKKITYEPLVLGITRASLEVDSFLSASSFQQTTRILSEAAIYKKKDFLKGLKENVILGNLIPAGTGYLVNQDDIYSKI